ncbi:biotin--[acetyl-CoA-carboxylase] ligase [Rhizobium sp. L1K21]|uniref:biotin--[acetyl-CoA-carboxylase] ligase n=1 Tax=Rhizobium sp. L1K21 TaxID=2954933 RepID=UPI00209252B5|nr:biotin--[acetyl-CoA-carboxylase] ligase [Rhizobium sp. L1K21]MCO6186091.1 biotin--[acetyl-CoA-carboxylase] ligase [Rhizobium sp. L1K21]
MNKHDSRNGLAFRHIALGDTVSTNLECFERARNGDPGGLWITAERQTGGRARRGRSWVSERGNLYSSLLLIDPAPIEQLASLPLVISVALHDAIKPLLPLDREIAIKWPNDLLISGAKVSGILLEGEQLRDGRYALVIGCGVNVAHKPTETPYPATCLNDEGANVSAEELFARFYAAMAAMLQRWDQGRQTSQVVKRWRHAAKGIGEKIKVNLPDRTLEGVFADIDERGMLLLDQGNGNLKTIAAGDVFFA